MRISDFSGKEIIDISDGARLGVIEECELVLDEKTGKISGIILPKRKHFFDFRTSAQHILIPWQTIKRIGDDIVIIDLGEQTTRTGRLSRWDF
ncbi:MAG: YlmC/YmxH family sporulation protein [Sporomusaceae bacterium]|jgi:YlmC/YmxH family sporulation protein|nr:YlmC/YmxH family sporulation protein [Sporomusaceae bacterium]